MPFSLIPPFRRWRQEYYCKFKATLCTSGHPWLQSETSNYWQSCFDLLKYWIILTSHFLSFSQLLSNFIKKKTKTKWSWVSEPHFLKKLFSFSLCTLVFCLHICLWESVISPGTEVTDSWWVSCGFWELNAGPLEDQPVPLTFNLSTWEVEAWGSGI